MRFGQGVHEDLCPLTKGTCHVGTVEEHLHIEEGAELRHHPPGGNHALPDAPGAPASLHRRLHRAQGAPGRVRGQLMRNTDVHRWGLVITLDPNKDTSLST